MQDEEGKEEEARRERAKRHTEARVFHRRRGEEASQIMKGNNVARKHEESVRREKSEKKLDA